MFAAQMGPILGEATQMLPGPGAWMLVRWMLEGKRDLQVKGTRAGETHGMWVINKQCVGYIRNNSYCSASGGWCLLRQFRCVAQGNGCST